MLVLGALSAIDSMPTPRPYCWRRAIPCWLSSASSDQEFWLCWRAPEDAEPVWGQQEVVPANIAKPCTLQQGLEVPVDDVQGVHRRADCADHEAFIPPIGASSVWSEPSRACWHRTLEKGCSVP